MWRYIADTVRGSSHERSGEDCQDFHVAATAPEAQPTALLACVSDGAGSAAHSRQGAQIACEEIAQRARRCVDQHGGFQAVSRDDVVAWCRAARDAIGHRAEAHEHTPRDYACTLSVALADEDHAVFFQIGDGAIVARRSGAYGVVFWPQSGEYANSTNFLTQPDFERQLAFDSVSGRFDELALFTDGLERLALSFQNQTPHAPFFDPLFEAVRQSQDLPALNEQLRTFLTSTTVQNRSDDDKTVILAAQHPGE